MKREFLTQPLDWTRTPRAASAPAEQACALQGPKPPTPAERVAGAALAVFLGIVGAAMLAHWWAS